MLCGAPRGGRNLAATRLYGPSGPEGAPRRASTPASASTARANVSAGPAGAVEAETLRQISGFGINPGRREAQIRKPKHALAVVHGPVAASPELVDEVAAAPGVAVAAAAPAAPGDLQVDGPYPGARAAAAVFGEPAVDVGVIPGHGVPPAPASGPPSRTGGMALTGWTSSYRPPPRASAALRSAGPGRSATSLQPGPRFCDRAGRMSSTGPRGHWVKIGRPRAKRAARGF
jgi:hypothetical protein